MGASVGAAKSKKTQRGRQNNQCRSQVRKRLSAGGRWIRTIGPAREKLHSGAMWSPCTAPPASRPRGNSQLQTADIFNLQPYLILRLFCGRSVPSVRAPGQREYPAVRVGRRYRQPCRRAKTRVGASLAQLYTCQRDGSVRDQGTRADPDPAHPWPPRRDRTAEPNNKDSR